MMRTFTCEGCRQVCDTDVPVEEVLAEARALFVGDEITLENAGSLCDDCYGRFLTWYRTLSEEDLARFRAEDEVLSLPKRK